MPLSAFQEELAKLLSLNRSPEAYLAGGAALHLEPNSKRFSNDLDYFHDSEQRLQEAFGKDKKLLEENAYQIELQIQLPQFVRAVVSRGDAATKVEWVHDTAWRFFPVVKDEQVGFRLHPVDLAINKVLALVGRREARDFLDTIEAHENILSLGALCWAACSKDPGYTPLSLLELVKRQSIYRPEDFSSLDLTEPVDLPFLKQRWLAAVAQAEEFILGRPPEEVGCLYYSLTEQRVVSPSSETPLPEDIKLHFGRPGGVLPQTG